MRLAALKRKSKESSSFVMADDLVSHLNKMTKFNKKKIEGSLDSQSIPRANPSATQFFLLNESNDVPILTLEDEEGGNLENIPTIKSLHRL